MKGIGASITPIRLAGLVAACCVLAACSPEQAASLQVAADDSRIRYTGRWIFDDPPAPRVGWQGSTATLRFRGSAISADIDLGEAGERLRVIVDGVPEEPARFISGGRQTISLAAGLDPVTDHTVTVMKEAYATSTLIFHGFQVSGDEILPPPPRPQRRIAFFGDSNMEGYSLYSEKNRGNNGTWFAYPAMVSRMLGAEMQLQAKGSARLDSDGPNDVVSFVYSPMYGAENPGYRDSFEPQVIVVNAGANDISRADPARREQLVRQNYRNAIAALRDMYGAKPHIILMNGYSWDPEEPANYSQDIVDEIGGNLSVLLFPWCWEQWHGDMVDHAGQARRLAAYIVSLGLGFSLQRKLDVVDGYGIGQDVANGSFEGGARDGYGGFGWRYFEDGAERINDPGGAAQGDYYLRLNAGEVVHQCVDATGDFEPGAAPAGQRYALTAAMRSPGGTGVVGLGADYEGQPLYARRDAELHEFSVTGEWRQYTATLTAPADAWDIYVVLRSVDGNVDIDNVQLSTIDTPGR